MDDANEVSASSVWRAACVAKGVPAPTILSVFVLAGSGCGLGAAEVAIIAVVTVVALAIPIVLVAVLLARGRGKAVSLGQATARITSLRARGEPAVAKVESIERTGEGALARVVLLVERSGQAPYRVESLSLVQKVDLPRAQPGCTVPVKVDPSDPAQVVLDLAPQAAPPKPGEVTSCPYCQQRLSPTDVSCPNCGSPITVG